MRGSSTTQGHFENVVRGIFPRHNVVANARKESQIRSPSSDYFLELDVWIPTLNLGFEFQDEHHFMTTWYYNRPLELISQRDSFKQEIVGKTGVTLVHVPCWWDGNAESLQASINFNRPETCNMLGGAPAIPLNPYAEFFNVRKVKHVGELMGASFSASVEGIRNEVSPENPWWLGEKYDGIRCCWNSISKNLYSRVGNKLSINSSYVNGMPAIFLDCEAWFGRGSFGDSAAILHHESTKVPFMRLIAFDKPDINTQHLEFEKRYKIVLKSTARRHPFVIVAMRMRCSDTNFLALILNTLIGDGAEGVIIRKKNTPYICGRSDLLWKLKTVRDDAEALVVREEQDLSLLLQTPNGKMFHVPPPSSTTTRVKRGEVVTFSFDNYTRNSLPTNPKILHVRYDLNWGDVVREFLVQNKKASEAVIPVKAQGYWNVKNRRNVRMYFESFAKRRGLDPLLPVTWYSVARDLRRQKEMRVIVTNYGSYIKALQSAFPEVKFQEAEFSSMPNNFWTDIQNRYKFLSKLARRNGFDPLVPEGWYSIPPDIIMHDKDVNSIISYYNYSFSKALLHLFPNIGLDKTVLSSLVNPYTVSHQKVVLQKFAERQGFDPLVAENWYSISADVLASHSDTRFITKLYKGSLKSAISTIFPNIGLVIENFELKDVKVLSMGERRQFFDDFARAANFDPLSPSNWYSVKLESILEKKNAYALLKLYKRNLIDALMDIYPELSFDKAKFGYWERPSNRKLFFNKYAQRNGFDPLVAANWYSVKRKDVLHTDGASDVMQYYKGSVTLALLQLFPRIGLTREKFASAKKKRR